MDTNTTATTTAEARCAVCKLPARLCDVPNTLEAHPTAGLACFKCRDAADLIAKILPMLVAAPSWQLNQTTIAKRLGRTALSIGAALTKMVRGQLIECPIKNPNAERPSAKTYRLTEHTIAALPARLVTK